MIKINPSFPNPHVQRIIRSIMSRKNEIKFLQDLIIEFRDERNWKQFHNPKDSAISLNLEASELLEHFQWKNLKEITTYVKKNKNEIGDELSDILFWVLLMSYDLKINIADAFIQKLEKNKLKYPIEKSKGKHIKYNKLK